MPDKTKQKQILVADDNLEIQEILEILLTSEGYLVKKAYDGQAAIDMVDSSIDLIILDVMMPTKSGFVACAEIREKTKAPILFLTAKSQDSDKSIGFAAGGDDYLSKPFSYSELLGRVKSLLRRYYVYQGVSPIAMPTQVLTYKDLAVNLDSQTVTLSGKVIPLTSIEYAILSLLLKHPKKIFSAENLYESVWNEQYFYSANNNVMVHIRNLRKKIEPDAQNPIYIKTAWGKGYYIED